MQLVLKEKHCLDIVCTRLTNILLHNNMYEALKTYSIVNTVIVCTSAKNTKDFFFISDTQR